MSVAGAPRRRPASLDPGDHQGDERRRPAARRAAREPPPQPAQPARGGRGLPAAARRLRVLPRAAGHPDRPLATADLQHAAPAQAAASRATPGCRRRVERRTRPRPARHGRWRRDGAHGPTHRRRGAVGAQRRGAVALGEGNDAPKARRPRQGGRHPQLDDLTTDLSDHLETRVAIALGQRKGKITVEFASVEDLRRILGLMGVPASAGAEALRTFG